MESIHQYDARRIQFSDMWKRQRHTRLARIVRFSQQSYFFDVHSVHEQEIPAHAWKFRKRTQPIAYASCSTLRDGPALAISFNGRILAKKQLGTTVLAAIMALLFTLSVRADTYIINGQLYATSAPTESLTAVFTQPDGGVTVNPYSG
jgi:hypothetical protein